jgi:hypothetical protein
LMTALSAGPGYHLRRAPGSSYLMSAPSAGPGYHLRLAAPWKSYLISALSARPGYHFRLAPGSSYLMSALSAGPGYHLRLAPGSPCLKPALWSAPGLVPGSPGWIPGTASLRFALCAAPALARPWPQQVLALGLPWDLSFAVCLECKPWLPIFG